MTAHVRIGDPISCGDVVAQGSGNCFTNGIPTSRVGDLTAGHCYPPVPLLIGAPTVFFNNRLAAVVGNPIPSHTCDDDTHGGNIANGSPNCFALNTGASVNSGLTIINRYIQSQVPVAFAAEQHDDDQGSDPVYKSVRTTYSPLQPSTPIITEVAKPSQIPMIKRGPVPSDCTDIFAASSYPPSFQLSPNFTLAMLTTDTLVSNYTIRGQVGLTMADIVCNLRHLCLNVLEPLLTKYGSTLVINSGFRHGAGTSQHYNGEAADVSFKNIKTKAASWERAKEIPSVVPFDQFIFEQNLSVWFHVSYRASDNRSSILTKPRGEVYYAGLVQFAS